MAVGLQLEGIELTNLISYSIGEDATPVSMSDSSGGIGQFTVSLPEWEHWRSARRKPAILTDTSQGFTEGRISVLNPSNGLISLSADSRIIAMAVKRKAKPFVGTLEAALRYYLGLVGITTGILVDGAVANREVMLAGFNDEIFTYVQKKLCPAMGIEMSLVSNRVVFRELRQRDAITLRTSSISRTIEEGDPAQSVKISWSRKRFQSDVLVYPVGGWNPDVEVYSVNANETKVIEDIPIQASLNGAGASGIGVLHCVYNVGPNDGQLNVYAVAGNDGLPITPAQWNEQGGSISVEVNDDTQSLKLTIVGPSMERYSPYTIGVAQGPSDYYSSLRIGGNGIHFDLRETQFYTNLTEDDAPTELGADIDGQVISTEVDAHRALMWSLAAAIGPKVTLEVNTSGINRLSDNGSYQQAYTADWNLEFAGYRTQEFNTRFAGWTADEFDEFWRNRVSSDFKNQAFGNVAGSIFFYDGSYFRARTVTNQSGNIRMSADQHNVPEHFNKHYAGMTTQDFNQMWAGSTTEEFNISPFKGFEQ